MRAMDVMTTPVITVDPGDDGAGSGETALRTEHQRGAGVEAAIALLGSSAKAICCTAPKPAPSGGCRNGARGGSTRSPPRRRRREITSRRMAEGRRHHEPRGHLRFGYDRPRRRCDAARDQADQAGTGRPRRQAGRHHQPRQSGSRPGDNQQRPGDRRRCRRPHDPREAAKRAQGPALGQYMWQHDIIGTPDKVVHVSAPGRPTHSPAGPRYT